LHQFVHRGTPKRLPDQLRRELAELLGTPEVALIDPDAQSDDLPLLSFDDAHLAIAPKNFAARLAIARAQSPYPLPSSFAKAARIDAARYRSLEEGEAEPSIDELDRMSWISGKSLEWLVRGSTKHRPKGKTSESTDRSLKAPVL